MSLQPGEVLYQRYQVVRSLKAGGMGAVYEGVDRNLADTPCAIKEVLLSALQGPDADYVLRSFASEMKALANLNHPNIPRVRDFFEVQGKRYIVMDLVQGQALDDELAEHLRVTGQPMDPAVAALDMVALLETLQYLHSCQPPLVHRDVKPANLIRDQRSGQIRLVDFGIARSVETQRIQTQVGTPGFCAPEQMAGRAEPRSDLFSVGATLSYLVTGKMAPFYAYQAMKPELPDYPGLADIIARATEVRAQDRYSSASEMAEALKRWLREQSLPTSTRNSPPPRLEPAAPLTRPVTAATRIDSNPWMMGSLIALLLVVSLTLFLSTPTPDEPVPSASRSNSPSPVTTTDPSPLAVASPPHPALPRRPRQPEVRPTPAKQRVEQPTRRHPLPTPAVTRPRLDDSPSYPKRLVTRRPLERRQALQESPPLPNPPPQKASMPRFPGPDSGFELLLRRPGVVRFRRMDGPTELLIEAHWSNPEVSSEEIAQSLPDQSFRNWLSSPAPSGEICRYRQAGSTHAGLHIKPGIIFKLHSNSMTRSFHWAPVYDFINATHW